MRGAHGLPAGPARPRAPSKLHLHRPAARPALLQPCAPCAARCAQSAAFARTARRRFERSERGGRGCAVRASTVACLGAQQQPLTLRGWSRTRSKSDRRQLDPLAAPRLALSPPRSRPLQPRRGAVRQSTGQTSHHICTRACPAPARLVAAVAASRDPASQLCISLATVCADPAYAECVATCCTGRQLQESCPLAQHSLIAAALARLGRLLACRSPTMRAELAAV